MVHLYTHWGVYGFGRSPNRKHIKMMDFGVFQGLNTSMEGLNISRKGLDIKLGLDKGLRHTLVPFLVFTAQEHSWTVNTSNLVFLSYFLDVYM